MIKKHFISLKRLLLGGVQKYSVFLLILLLSSIFIACPNPQGSENPNPENPQQEETAYPKTLTEQEKTTIADLSFSTMEESIASLEKIITILEKHKNESGLSSYISKIKTTADAVKAGNLSILSAETIDVNVCIREKENNADAIQRDIITLDTSYTDENGVTQSYKNVDDYNAAREDAISKIDEYWDYAHGEYLAALNDYANAFNAAHENHPAYDALLAYLQGAVSDFKDNYILDRTYNTADVNRLIAAAKTEQSKLLDGSAYAEEKASFENAETELNRLESEAKQAVDTANTFTFVRQDGSTYTSGDNPQEPNPQEPNPENYSAEIWAYPVQEYSLGSDFSLNGLSVAIYNSDGQVIDYVNYPDYYFSYDVPDMSVEGEKTVELSFTYKQAVYVVSYVIWVEEYVEHYSASIWTYPRTRYQVNEAFSLKGMKIEIRDSNGETVDVLDSDYEYIYDIPDMSTTGSKYVTISFYYKEKLYAVDLYFQIDDYAKITFDTDCDAELEPILLPKGHALHIYSNYVYDTTEGSQYFLDVESFKKEGFLFTDWYLDKELTIPALSEDYSDYIIEDDITLYAKWEKGMTVSFETNCDIEIDSITVPENDEIYIDYTKDSYYFRTSDESYAGIQMPQKGDLYFDGWYLDSDFTERLNEWPKYQITEDITLYARFAEKVAINTVCKYVESQDPIYIFKGHHIKLRPGTGSGNFDISDGTANEYYSIHLPFTEESYCNGWYLDAAYTQKLFEDSYEEWITVTDDITIYPYYPELTQLYNDIIEISSEKPFSYKFNAKKGSVYLLRWADDKNSWWSYEAENKVAVTISILDSEGNVCFSTTSNGGDSYTIPTNILSEKDGEYTLQIVPAEDGTSGQAKIIFYEDSNRSRKLEGIIFNLSDFDSQNDYFIQCEQNGSEYTFSLHYKDETGWISSSISAEWYIGIMSKNPAQRGADSFTLDFADYKAGNYVILAVAYGRITSLYITKE